MAYTIDWGTGVTNEDEQGIDTVEEAMSLRREDGSAYSTDLMRTVLSRAITQSFLVATATTQIGTWQSGWLVR